MLKLSFDLGSSSRPINNPNLYWGGLVYGVDSQDIRLWAPSYGQANYGKIRISFIIQFKKEP
jgi:hypothetical protein